MESLLKVALQKVMWDLVKIIKSKNPYDGAVPRVDFRFRFVALHQRQFFRKKRAAAWDARFVLKPGRLLAFPRNNWSNLRLGGF